MTAAVLMLHQQEAITCADGFAFTGSIDGLLAHCSSLCISAVLAARAVSVTVKKSINPTFHSFVVVFFQKILYRSIFWISYLHFAWLLNLQLEVQQGSSLRWRSPGSQSSPFSTLEFPQTLLFLSLKHSGALWLNVFSTETLLQLEKCLRKNKKIRINR